MAKPQTKSKPAPAKKPAKSPAKPLTKTALIQELGEVVQGGKRDAAAVLDALVKIAYREAKKVGEFTIPGIGKLVKQKRAARIGRNPKTGEKLKIAAKTVVKLRLSKSAKDAIL